MSKSKNQEVQNFLADIEILNPQQFALLQELRNIVFEVSSKSKNKNKDKNKTDAKERLMYGGIMFTFERDWGGIFAHKNHVSFEFSKGYLFNDPYSKLEGGGKFRRHLKLRSLANIQENDVKFFVTQAIENDAKTTKTSPKKTSPRKAQKSS